MCIIFQRVWTLYFAVFQVIKGQQHWIMECIYMQKSSAMILPTSGLKNVRIISHNTNLSNHSFLGNVRISHTEQERVWLGGTRMSF
jgi:hypothetical protein